ncbi:MAG TPA: hypothetical protein VGL29_21905 [Blastocatellia bacterium]|jgi:hypothetical protein
MPRKKKSTDEGRKAWPKRSPQPVVFSFQPTEYEVVPPNRLAEWEDAMVKSVGFPADLVKGLSKARGVETFSFCPRYDD